MFDTQSVIKQILEKQTNDIEAIKNTTDKLIASLNAIPTDFTGDVLFNGYYIVVGSTDKNLFLQIARKLGVKVDKSTDMYSRTGNLIVNGNLRSAATKLPDTCKFESVTKSYTMMEPVGDCGSWFDTKEEK